jgi:hypothetical protein
VVRQKNLLILITGCFLGIAISTTSSVFADKKQSVSLPFEGFILS